MEEFWARYIEPSGQLSLNYWEYFAECLAQLVDIPVEGVILDIGTYDGNVLFKALQRMEAPGFGVGADINAGGFFDGVKQANQWGWKNHVTFVQADVNMLGFQDSTFDIVLSNFLGLDLCYDFDDMQFTGPNWMMSEILRVLKPGGRVGIGSWVEQHDFEWMITAFRKYLPTYQNDMICYSKENPDGQQAILLDGGFINIQVHPIRVGFAAPDPEIWWTQMTQAIRAYFEQINDPQTMADFKAQVLADLREHHHPAGIRFDKSVSFVVGTKPM